MTLDSDIQQEEAARRVAEAGRILSAIGAAWSTFTLYPNPERQPAFTRAIEVLGSYEGSGLVLEVGPGTFTYHGEEIPGTREGLDRLATQLFIHDVEWLRINRPPTAADLVRFFEVASRERAEGDPAMDHALVLAEVSALSVRIRGLLGEIHDDDGDAVGHEVSRVSSIGGTRSEIAALVEGGADPGAVANQLLEQAGGDDDLLAKHFVGAFVELYGPDLDTASEATLQQIGEMLLPYLAEEAPAMPIVTFVETFKVLPEDAQSRVFEMFLDSIDDVTHRLFVDQFGGTELRQLADQLDEDQAGALLAYVREALDQDDGSFDDLLPPLRSSDDVRQARQEAADRVTSVLGDPSQRLDLDAAAFDEMRRQLAEADTEAMGLEVMGRLFAIERRPHRFRRLVRVWSGRIGALIRRNDFAGAIRTLNAVQEDPGYQPEDRVMIDEALGRLVTDDLLAALWTSTGDEGSTEVLELVTALGPAVTDRLIEEMATEENAGRRKVLVELLGELGAQNARPLVRRLDDPRWYVVRNLATVLGKSGNPRAVKPLRDLAFHDDYRVRLEALRALVPLDPTGATDVLVRALTDSNQRITQLALTYLRNGKRSIEPLVEVVATGDIAGDVLVDVIDIIAQQGGPAAASALEEIAGRKFAVRGSDRAARQAAKDALKRLQT